MSLWIASSSCLVLKYFVFICSKQNIKKFRLLFMFRCLWCSGIIAGEISQKPHHIFRPKKKPFLFKAGVHLKAVFQIGIKLLMQISCLCFKRSRISMLFSHIYVLGRFANFLVIFRYNIIWR